MRLYHEEIKYRFHLGLGRMVHAYSQFDFMVGLAPNWLGPRHGEDVSELLVSRHARIVAGQGVRRRHSAVYGNFDPRRRAGKDTVLRDDSCATRH